MLCCEALQQTTTNTFAKHVQHIHNPCCSPGDPALARNKQRVSESMQQATKCHNTCARQSERDTHMHAPAHTHTRAHTHKHKRSSFSTCVQAHQRPCVRSSGRKRPRPNDSARGGVIGFPATWEGQATTHAKPTSAQNSVRRFTRKRSLSDGRDAHGRERARRFTAGESPDVARPVGAECRLSRGQQRLTMRRRPSCPMSPRQSRARARQRCVLQALRQGLARPVR